MNATISTKLLPPEVAVAARLVNESRVPCDLFAWLRSPRRIGSCPHDSGALAIAIEEIVGPMARDADTWLARELKHASMWYGFAIQHYVTRESPDIAKRQILTALLPLYRCLATGELARSYTISRHRFAEILLVSAMQGLIGEPLTELLDAAEQTRQCPESIIAAHLDFGVEPAASVAMDLCARSDDGNQSDEVLDWIATQEIEDFAHDVESWAEPALLWRLAGEIIDRKPNTVLPRSWVDIPVTWPSVTGHWRRIEAEIDRLLSHLPVEQLPASDAISTMDTNSQTLDGQNRETNLETLTDALECELGNDLPRQTLKSTVNSRKSQSAGSDADAIDELHASACYATAEVHNHSDPVFVSALSRTMAVARKEQRSLSLATIVVLPDGDAHVDYFDIGADGIKRWQSRLIDNMSSHPELPDAKFYVTDAGEVIVTVLDLDRGLATELIRESIVETLSGTSDESSLLKVDVPAKFHVGIATTARPGPTMSPEELIAPVRRCFSAAASQGGAAIKSIEVY